ncbi:hypothetical protein [Pseudoteredinibacter isoporae]|uniref:hypothetical protein n=1 Tax=Pseudoteredinibacter isoporae TaxID=570281 RepID=UPI0031042C23
MKSIQSLCIGLCLYALTSPGFANTSDDEASEPKPEMSLIVDQSRLQIHRSKALEATPRSSEVFDHIQLHPVSVTFRRNWRRDYNLDRNSLSNHISKQDEDELRQKTAELFDEEFSKLIPEHSRLALSSDATAKTLVLKPRIVDLVINAPDLKHSNASRRLKVYSAGKATLLLDVFDGSNGELLGTIRSKREATEYHQLRNASSVFNRSEAKRIIRRWVKNLDRNLTTLLDGTTV